MPELFCFARWFFFLIFFSLKTKKEWNWFITTRYSMQFCLVCFLRRLETYVWKKNVEKIEIHESKLVQKILINPLYLQFIWSFLHSFADLLQLVCHLSELFDHLALHLTNFLGHFYFHRVDLGIELMDLLLKLFVCCNLFSGWITRVSPLISQYILVHIENHGPKLGCKS